MHKPLKKKVAIVDDIKDIITIYSKALEKHGHEVIFTSTSGEEIVKAVKDGELYDLDVVIMDYRMKGINGLEAAREILRQKPDIKIIMATGDDTIMTTINESQEVKIDCYMIKPIKTAKLIQCVNELR